MRFAKIIIFFFIILALVYGVYKYSPFFQYGPKRTFDNSGRKLLSIIDGGLYFQTYAQAMTIGDFLAENKISLSERDYVYPEKDAPIFSGMQIEIRQARKIKISADGKNIDGYALGKNIGEALLENNITLGRLDKIEPAVNFPAGENLKITVTRINVEEKVIAEDIEFKIIEKPDKKLNWREKKIQQPGEKGVREVKYRITYKNNREVSRAVLEKKIIKQPVEEIIIQGTYMELGKANKGQGTWYARKGGLFAASTTLPKGSYAKVTNTANGKSVVVQINDYGPQGKGRIIDLDKVAFAKIASLGAGVIGVKVEPILN